MNPCHICSDLGTTCRRCLIKQLKKSEAENQKLAELLEQERDKEEPKKEIKSEYICEDEFQKLFSGDVNEVIIDGVKYKKVTKTIVSWRKIS